MREARAGEPEVVEPVIEPFARDRDAEIRHVGKIRQAHATGLVDLAEHHVLLRAMKRPPAADATLQRSPDTGGQVGMAALHLLEDRDGAQIRRRLQHRHDLAVKEIGKRIRPAALPRLLFIGWQSAILLEAISGRRTDRRLRRRDRRRICLSERHVEPHLVIGDMATRQWVDPFDEKIHPHTEPVAITRSPGPLARLQAEFFRACASGRATPSLHPRPGKTLSSRSPRTLTLIVARQA